MDPNNPPKHGQKRPRPAEVIKEPLVYVLDLFSWRSLHICRNAQHPCTYQPRSQGHFPGLRAGREKTLASAGHVSTLHPENLGVIN